MDKNSFALRPPMGWNSYDYYDTNVKEADVLANARYMAQNLKPYGWEYVVVDIQWYAHATASQRDRFQYIPFGTNEMDSWGRLLPCPEKFPSSVNGAGFRPLADQIHSLGLKFGIHIMRGIPRLAAHLHLPILGTGCTADQAADPSSICPWNPDMYGLREGEAGQAYYDSLLQLYAQWGVDFIKCDDICATGFGERTYGNRHEVEMLHRAIEKCGRPMVLSLSPGPALVAESWHYKQYANMWRITDDFWDSWEALRDMFDRCEKWQDHVSPGCWPDCDMLPLGRLGKHFGQERSTRLTKSEQKTMLSLWCLFGSPLMLGAELTKLEADTLALLQNRALLALVRGDFTGRQLERSRNHRLWGAWDGKTCYLGLFNLTDSQQYLELRPQAWATRFPEGSFPKNGSVLEEVWTGQKYEIKNHCIGATVEPHGVLLLRLCDKEDGK